MKRKLVFYVLVLAMLLALPANALAQTGGGPVDRASVDRSLPQSVAELKLASPVELSDASALMPELTGPGRVQVIIRLSADSVAEAQIAGKAMASSQVKEIAKNQQSAFMGQIQALDPKAQLLGRLQVLMNAIFVEVDTAVLPSLVSDPAVERIAPIGEYELDLTETVPYIGASTVQGLGYDGTGVRVAVLDSGIDYYHANLGGSGNPADFAADDPTIIEAGTFPTAKVVGGIDFVGSNWPDTDLEPDPDPLDAGAGGGHGTHVADIIGGANGVAPGASLYAVKVCSSVSTSCSGVAMFQGLEWAVDPNGDSDTSDHVDVVNMSIGAVYGQSYDDDTSYAVNMASALGVLTVASAGNSGDKPYVTGTPGAALTALSVAQTNVPSAMQPFLEVTDPATIAGLYPAVFQSWSAPLTTVLAGPLQYGDGAGGNLDGCAAFAAGSLTGKIVLVDRGSCNFTLKIKNIGDAGGLVGIIGLITADAPFDGGDGGDRPILCPGYMVSQATSNALKANIPTTYVNFDPALGVPLVGSMVATSSRGPRNPDSFIKPEIGAPGASVSAVAGSGTGTAAFGGTSGAAPMVTGSAALLFQAYPTLSPAEVKARLMNNGETAIVTDAMVGELAPISRIGGGEVRVDAALMAPAAAWDTNTMVGALSFGFVDTYRDVLNLYKQVRVRNYTAQNITYNVSSDFRFANDEATGAVTVQTPAVVRVPANSDATFWVKLVVNAALLPGNYMNSGSMGGDPAALTLNEYDGYVTLDDGTQPIHLAWHILPRKAAIIQESPLQTFSSSGTPVALTNIGAGPAQLDAFSLLALSMDIAEGGPGMQSPTPDIRAVGINTFPVPAGYCSGEASFIWAFAIHTYGRQSHLLPVSHQVALDINQDGTFDYVVLNRDVSGLGTVSDGRQLSYALDLATGAASAYFFAEHATNTRNTVLYICGEQVGLTGTDMLATNVDMEVYAQDFYFGGPGDGIGGLTVTPYSERFWDAPADIPAYGTGSVTVLDFGQFPGDSLQRGLMVITNGDRGSGLRGGSIEKTEALFFIPGGD